MQRLHFRWVLKEFIGDRLPRAIVKVEIAQIARPEFLGSGIGQLLATCHA
jgi:hypothetical protein